MSNSDSKTEREKLADHLRPMLLESAAMVADSQIAQMKIAGTKEGLAELKEKLSVAYLSGVQSGLAFVTSQHPTRAVEAAEVAIAAVITVMTSAGFKPRGEYELSMVPLNQGRN